MDCDQYSNIIYKDDYKGGIDANCKVDFIINNKSYNLPVSFLISMTGPLKNKFILKFKSGTLEVPVFQNEKIYFFPKNSESQPLCVNLYENNFEDSHYSVAKQLFSFANSILDKKLSDYVSAKSQLALTKFIDDCYASRITFNKSW